MYSLQERDQFATYIQVLVLERVKSSDFCARRRAPCSCLPELTVRLAPPQNFLFLASFTRFFFIFFLCRKDGTTNMPLQRYPSIFPRGLHSDCRWYKIAHVRRRRTNRAPTP